MLEHSEARLTRCEKAWARIQPLIATHGSALFDPTFRKAMLAQQAQIFGCSIVSLYKDLRRFWQRGQTKYALLPDYQHSGRSQPNPDEPEAAVAITAGRGRKPKQHTTYQITTQDTSWFHEIIKREYLNNQQITMVDAYTSLVNKYYRYPDGNADWHVNPPGDRPSLRQFRLFLSKNYDLEMRTRGRVGDSDYEREHRKRLGTIMADCLGVGHYYEIDATIADIYLVSSEDITKIIGKPTLYLIIDRKSRLIVGFYFGLENASWIGAMQAILSISEDKRALCARYGVKYDPDDWPAHQVFPSEFLADRGDMISHASSSIVEGLHVTVTNLPAKRPDWKPLVECGFKQAHNHLRSIAAPAYDPPSNATKRRGKHYEKDACLTMKDFGNLILNTIIAHNHREIPAYDLSNKELLDGVRPAPVALWNHGIVSRSGLLTRYEEPTVRFALLRKKKASVTDHGIEFEGCYYSCPEAIEQKWFETARKKRFTVDVSYDSRLADSIYVHSLQKKGEPYVATLSARSSKYRGMSFDEVAYCEAMRALLRHESEHTRMQNSIDLRNVTEPVISAARKKLKAEGRKVSRTARRADIKEVRGAERSLERKVLAVIQGDKAPHTPTAEPDTPLPSGSPLVAEVTSLSGSPPARPPSMEERVAAARARMVVGQ